MGILQAQLDELHAKKAADGLSPAEEEAMNAIIAKMEELADLAGDYRDAVEESEDILNEIEDVLRQNDFLTEVFDYEIEE